MNVSRIATALAVLSLAASSCMKGDVIPDSEDSEKIVGYVTDTDDNFIEHIKLTFDWNNGTYQEIKYTDSHGQFQSDYWQPSVREAVTLTITLEDVDGEENGGLFETANETITLFENGPQASVEPIVFRLNRATASENIPQI